MSDPAGELAAGAAVLRDRGGAKYTAIMNRLREVAGRRPSGAKLPTLRELAERYGTTLPTVQRAVNELVGEGVLRTEARAGIFVAERRRTPAPLPDPARELSVDLSSTLPHQQAAWDEVFDRFAAEHRYLRVAPATGEADLVECGPILDDEAEPRSWLDLTPLLGAELTAPLRGATQYGRPFCPVHLHLPCLIVNRDLLAELDLETPAFASFVEQAAFVRQCDKRAAAKDHWGCITVQQPALWLGCGAMAILEWLETDGEPPRGLGQQVEMALTQVMALARLVRRGPKHRTPRAEMRWFLEGRVALYLGWTYEVGALAAAPPPFSWEVLPWLAADGQPQATVLSLAISAASRRPVESVRLLQMLRRPAVQERLPDFGVLPVDPDSRRLPPSFPASRRELWQERLRQAVPMPSLDPLNSYLFRSIILDGIWAGIDHGQKAREVLHGILELGRAYRRSRKEQEHQWLDQTMHAPRKEPTAP